MSQKGLEVSNDTNGRQTISGGHGVTNTLDATGFQVCITDTCRQIVDLLSDHCGPHATDALIIQDNTGTNLKDPHYAIFTKDGINIVKMIEFVSPIQRHIQNLIAYIGKRVEELSHDGTTTAMMFFSLLVLNYFELINTTLETGGLTDRKKLIADLSQVLKAISEGLESEMVMTTETLAAQYDIPHQDTIRYVAFQQAMLSSKGDRELAEAIVEVVETLPTELYGMFTISQSGLETDSRFSVIKDDFDFMLPVISNLDDMNHRMGTEYLAETCDILVSEDSLVQGNPALEILVKHLHDAENGGLTQDLVVIARSIDSSLMARINTINRSLAYKVILFPLSVHNPYSSKATVLGAMMAVASVYPIYEHLINPGLPYLIRDAKVHYKNKRLYVSNLYVKDTTRYHPSFNNKDRFLPYTKMVEDIKEHLDNINSGRVRVESAADNARYLDYIDIYRRMISADVRNLQLSGMRHDTMADRDVVQDSFGAVLSSLEHGFVFDGYLKLYLLAGRIEPTVASEMIRNTVRQILEYVHKYDAREKSLGTSSLFQTRLDSARDCVADGIKTACLYYPVDAMPSVYLDLFLTGEETPVIQPADTYRELFRRVNDLLPKLLNTNRAIIPGTVNTGVSK